MLKCRHLKTCMYFKFDISQDTKTTCVIQLVIPGTNTLIKSKTPDVTAAVRLNAHLEVYGGGKHRSQSWWYDFSLGQ